MGKRMKKNIIIISLLIIAIVAVVGVKNSRKTESEGDAPVCSEGICTLPVPKDQITSESTQTQAVVKELALPKLLDLGAGKCVPCKMMAPILDEMKDTFSGQLDVEFIDVWENEDAGKQYGIRMIPTQIFFDAKGGELFRHEGFYAREDMMAKWQELGFEFEDSKNAGE